MFKRSKISSRVGALLAQVILLAGCQGYVPQSPNVEGVATGAAGAEVANKVRESLTPHYPLYLQPLELCYLEYVKDADSSVTCIITPCENNCEISMTWDGFIERSPKFMSLQAVSKVFNAIKQFCDANGDKWCKEQLFKFSQNVAGEIVLVGDKKN